MNKYREVKELGRGQFGSVSLCTNLSTGQKVVIKTLNKGVCKKHHDSYKKEVKVMRLLNHPNIVSYVDSFEENGNCCIAME